MAYTWGSTTINISVENYEPPHRGGGMVRIDLLPDPDNLTDPAQVVQQTNTKRKTVRGILIFDNYSDYQTMETDMINGQERELIAPGETGADYYIEQLGPPDYRQADVIFAPVTFVDVEAVSS